MVVEFGGSASGFFGGVFFFFCRSSLVDVLFCLYFGSVSLFLGLIARSSLELTSHIS